MKIITLLSQEHVVPYKTQNFGGTEVVGMCQNCLSPILEMMITLGRGSNITNCRVTRNAGFGVIESSECSSLVLEVKRRKFFLDLFAEVASQVPYIIRYKHVTHLWEMTV